MKTPIEWDDIPEVADSIIELIAMEAARSDDITVDGWYEEGKNSYGERGTVTIEVGGRTFQLAAYEVRSP